MGIGEFVKAGTKPSVSQRFGKFGVKFDFPIAGNQFQSHLYGVSSRSTGSRAVGAGENHSAFAIHRRRCRFVGVAVDGDAKGSASITAEFREHRVRNRD